MSNLFVIRNSDGHPNRVVSLPWADELQVILVQLFRLATSQNLIVHLYGIFVKKNDVSARKNTSSSQQVVPTTELNIGSQHYLGQITDS